MQLIILGLALVNLLWGASALVDPSIAREPTLPHPLLLFAAHTLSGSAMFFQKLRPYALLSTAALTAFYVLRVKPFEPLAEPQTVGILGITLSQLLPHNVKAVHQPKLDNFVEDFLLRVGIAYPLFEWGLDAYRNPLHFISYIRGNILARAVAAPLGIENTVFLIFVVEVSL
ncbi:MAG: hypothetical protein NZ941_01680, partial [Candidatus Caldarchaeum sp.]|nr:hypothetical protein [Candidatus Caldarchaeum sp.]MDW7977956.1 hypothetical protein [Candidatus Caldarchaeum sp.]